MGVNVAFSLRIKNSVGDKIFTTIFLIVQEVQKIEVKHSHVYVVLVEFRQKSKKTKLRSEDYGVGFKVKK